MAKKISWISRYYHGVSAATDLLDVSTLSKTQVIKKNAVAHEQAILAEGAKSDIVQILSNNNKYGASRKKVK